MVRLRFEDRFEYSILGTGKIPPDTPYPAMLLQPILENATIHGLADEGISKLQIEFYEKNNQLFTSIRDNGIGIEISKRKKEELGKKRISKGIKLLKEKIYVLNKMHQTDIKIEFIDLSKIKNKSNGTQVIISFSLSKMLNKRISPTRNQDLLNH